jgi:uncharacterized protein YndB with AHSA1/START domain
MNELPFSLDRDVLICATRATVFGFFTESARFALWWGAGSRIDARPGGELFIRYPNGLSAQGTVLEVEAPHRIVFSYGYDRPETPITPGGSRVTITLADEPGGTRVTLRHEVGTEALRDQHRPGWRYQLAVFASVAAGAQHAGAQALVDQWFAVWGNRDAASRTAALAALCDPGVVYRDRYAFCSGLGDLGGHIAAAQLHLPALLEREGDARHESGLLLADWVARKEPGGPPLARGTTVLGLTPGGKLLRVTGFWRA